MWIKQTISEQRKVLIDLLEPIMLNLSKACSFFWSDLNVLDKVLNTHFTSIPHCHLIYALDNLGKQKSSNINANGIDMSYRNQDLSRRPYSVSLFSKRQFTLSPVYISHTTEHPCISAVQPVVDEQQFLGFIVADFDMRRLPLSVNCSNPFNPQPQQQPDFDVPKSLQSRGRATNFFDKYLTDIHRILNNLISEHGVFHVTVHYSDAKTVLWQVDEPYQYRLYNAEQMLSPDMCLAYPRHSYFDSATISTRVVHQVLERFRTLRLVDDKIYLRSGSLNIMNGMISLTFSFDGSQYMLAEVFLTKDLSYWLKQVTTENNSGNYQSVNEKKLLRAFSHIVNLDKKFTMKN
jgi:hypothetical protein